MSRPRSKLLLATIAVACLFAHTKTQATPDLLEKLKGMSFKCPISSNDKLDGWYFEDSVFLTKGNVSMLKSKSYQRGVLTNLHSIANEVVVIDVVFHMKWRTKKKTKLIPYDRMGFIISLHNQAFDTQNLGPYQTVTMDGLNSYFIQDGQASKSFFGMTDSQEKLIINLPEVNEKNLTKVTKVSLEDKDIRIRINLNFKNDTYFLTLVDEVTSKKTPLVSERRIPSFLKNEQLFLTMYAYNGAATIGDVQIREISVRENLKSIVENFDNEMQKINKKMINDLIHSHVMQKQNKSLLTVMINEEEIGIETKTIRKISKIMQKELQAKLYTENGLREKPTETEDYKTKYDAMLKQLSSMLDMQRKLHDKMRESNKFLEAIEKLDSVYKEIEYVHQFSKNMEGLMKVQEVQDIILQLHALEQSLGPQIFSDMEKKVEESVEHHARRHQERQSGSWLWYVVFGLIVLVIGFMANRRVTKAEKEHIL